MNKIALTFSIVFFSCLATNAQNYTIVRDTATNQFNQQRYLDALNSFIYANSLYSKQKFPKDKDPKIWIKQCQDSLRILILRIQDEKEKSDSLLAVAKSALEKAEQMQRKVETAMFDKAVKEQFKEWKGYEKYLYSDKTINNQGKQILNSIDSINLSYNALLRLPKELAECQKLRHINLQGNLDINWNSSVGTLDKLSSKSNLKVSVYNLNNIPSQYHRFITGIEVLVQDTIPSNIFSLKQLTYLAISGDRYKSNSINSLPFEIFEFHNLGHLGITNCQIQNLPSEIEKLSGLKSLDLHGNQLNVLPLKLGKLVSLTSLNIGSNKLSFIPSEIGNLTNLTSLDISDNQLSVMPSEIRKLINLTSLDICMNKLDTLPSEIENLTNLANLEVYENKLVRLPLEIGKLKNLRYLDLEDNQLIGLPTEIGNLRNLTELYLSGNQISSLPLEIGNLGHLSELYLSGNQLSSLPPEIGKLINIRSLDLGSNQLQGLPKEIQNLSNLESLNLNDNKITNLPSGIGELINLNYLNLSRNYSLNISNVSNAFANFPKQIIISTENADHSDEDVLLILFPELSSLPPEIGSISNLTILDINENRISSLPSEIRKLNNLKYLNIKKNPVFSIPIELREYLQKIDTFKADLPFEYYFNSDLITRLDFNQMRMTALPPELGKLNNLKELNIQKNPIVAIPVELKEYLHSLQNFSSDLPLESYFNSDLITELNFRNCSLSHLPPEIWTLRNLISLDLGENHFYTITPEIGNLSNLQKLYLGSNQLNTLHQEIGNLFNLTSLYLSGNQLSSLPSEIGNLRNLKELNINGNHLTFFPTEIGKLKNLEYLYLGYNKIARISFEIGKLKKLGTLDLRGNQLSSLPQEISELAHLTILDLGSNHLNTLPEEIWKLSNLESLNLSNNHLDTLSPDIVRLSNLRTLDLEGNKLSNLPREIGKLNNLIALNLSNNQLITLPTEVGQLKKLFSLNLEKNTLKNVPDEIFTLNIRAENFDTIGKQLFISENYEQALLAWLKSLEKDSTKNNAFSYANAGLCYRLIGKPEKALEYLNRFLSFNLNNSWCLNQLMLSHYQLRQFKKSYQFAQKLTQLEPDNYSNWYNLSWFSLFVNQYKVAISAALKSLKLSSEKTGVISNLVLGYVLNNQWDKAESLYLEWKDKKFPDDERFAKEVFLQDIKDLEEAGISHPDFEKAKNLLNK